MKLSDTKDNTISGDTFYSMEIKYTSRIVLKISVESSIFTRFHKCKFISRNKEEKLVGYERMGKGGV